MTKTKPKAKQNYDIKGIMLITLGTLILVSIFTNSFIGVLGKIVKKLLFAFIGIGAYILPFLIIFIGIVYILKKGNIKFNRKFYGIIIFILNTMLLIQMLILDLHFNNINMIEGIKKIYYTQNTFHGGILSYIIDVPMYKLLGKVGCYIIFASLYIISFIFIFQINFNNIKSEINKKNKNSTKPILIDNNEKDNFIKNLNNKIKIIDFMKTNELDGIDETKIIENYNKLEEGIELKSEKEINDEFQKEIALSSQNSNYKYEFPNTNLLNYNPINKLNKDDKKDLINDANKLEETLSSFGVEAKVIQVTKGPSVTRFELQPSPGVKVSKIVHLADDIALNLASSGVRIEAPIPKKSAVGIEVPNKELNSVYLREVIENSAFVDSKKKLSFCLGKDIEGNCVVSDLTEMPHLLIAGATGSGKSVCINTLIISLLYKCSPKDVKLLLIDPKVVELSIYNGIPHLLIPVVTDPKKAASALNWAVKEMNKRYKLFANNNVRNIEGYNKLYKKNLVEEKLPLIIIIIDELADLMMVCANDVEDYIGRLSQMARAAGIHLVIATQRPSVDIITGVIKANIPSRISFAVSSQIDSRTILDMAGAEKLLGKGDMLFHPVGKGEPIRIQGAFISEREVENVVNYIKKQNNSFNYKEEILEEINNKDNLNKNQDEDADELLEEAINIVFDAGQASASMLQRKLKIGYNRAARIIDQMEDRGLISEKNGSKPRQIISKDYKNCNN